MCGEINKKKYKIIKIVSLVILMLGLTYISFTFWDHLTKSDDAIVDIGEVSRIEILVFALDHVEGKTLVHNVEYIIMKDSDVKGIEYTITV